jgi:hypothetical protein
MRSNVMISFKLWLEKTSVTLREAFVIPGNMDVGNKREDLEYIVELAFVCPKSQDQSRKFGAYLLPHDLQTVNMQLLDNPEYYDRCVIYDIGHDQKGHALLQDLKPTFKKVGSDHAELVFVYDKLWHDEEHWQRWKGDIDYHAPKIRETGEDVDFKHAYLLLYNREDGKRISKLKIPSHHAYNLFNVYENKILDAPG